MLVFPDFIAVPNFAPKSPDVSSSFATQQRYLQDTASQHEVDQVLEGLRSVFNWRNGTPNLSISEELRVALGNSSIIREPVVLICGHGARDDRCGIMGPLLQKQFEHCLAEQSVSAVVGQITHIGGHKFAGNAILYIPPSFGHQLAGRSIWYGRVEPRHVEGIIRETITGGRVIEELYRGSMAGAEP